MLLDDHLSLFPLLSQNVNLLCDIPGVLTLVTDQTNQNITSAQKDLLLWHQILSHVNFKWI